MGKKERIADEWERIWDAREKAFSRVLGKPDGKVFHSMIPLEFGGFADVLTFRKFLPGYTYVTADLSGPQTSQKRSKLGNYELMICTKSSNPQAADLISRLAQYTLEAKLNPGETMDIGNTLGSSTITALLFAHPSAKPLSIEFLQKKYGLLLCIGITRDEVKFRHEHSTEALLQLLNEKRVFPYTIPNRKSLLR